MSRVTSAYQLPYTKCVEVTQGVAFPDGACDGLMLDGPANPSPSAITITMDGAAVTFFNLAPGVIHPIRATLASNTAGMSVKAFYY